MYVHVPTLYAEHMGMTLSLLGGILLSIRLLDALIDPAIGYFSDRLRHHQKRIMALAVPGLLVGYTMLFSPPALEGMLTAWWLIGSLTLVYLSFSTLMINYYALGVNLTDDSHGHTKIALFRESHMLVGVLLASLLPAILLKHHSIQDAYRLFSLALWPLLIAAACLCLHSAPQPLKQNHAEEGESGFLRLLQHTPVRWVLFIGFCNAIPSAITSTLFMFFTADVLGAADESGFMLVVYFISAAAGMPLWSKASRCFGKARSLCGAMLSAIACFIWAWQLGEGDRLGFYVICVLSGATLGADSMLMPSILSDAIANMRGAAASAFGLWNLTTKLTMAAAAGIALPLLAYGGYQPGQDNSPQALAQLSLCYALLPCLFKLLAVASLVASPFFKEKPL